MKNAGKKFTLHTSFPKTRLVSLDWRLETEKSRPAAFRQKPVLYRPPVHTKVHDML